MGRTRQAHLGGPERSGGILKLVRLIPLAIVGAMACEAITADFSRVIAIGINAPSQISILVGDTLILEATAITAAGDTVSDAVIVWALLDVDSGQVGFTLDPPTGTVIGVSAGSGRVRAQVEELPSEPVTITVTPADTTAPDVRRDLRHRADHQ